MRGFNPAARVHVAQEKELAGAKTVETLALEEGEAFWDTCGERHFE